MKRKDKGYALVMVLIVFTILILFGSTLLTISLYDTRNVAYQEKKTKAYYTAYSGADSMASYIIGHPDEVSDIIDQTGTSEIGSNTLEVKVTNGPAADSLLITATGTVTNVSPANVKLYLEKEKNPAFDHTIFGDTLVKVGNNAVINGDVGTNASSINNKGTINGGINTNMGIVLPTTNPSIFTSNNGPYKLKDGNKLYVKASIVDDSLIQDISWDASHASGGKAQIHIFAENSLMINNIDPPSGITVFLYYNGTDSITDNNGQYYINHYITIRSIFFLHKIVLR
jgi:hypothetical protein